jgi:hypothetical protein
MNPKCKEGNVTQCVVVINQGKIDQKNRRDQTRQ